MIYGLLAALGWGTADLAAALSGRRIGSLLTVGVAQVSSLATLVVVMLASAQALHSTGQQAAILFLNGGIAAGAYICLYRGLELGPVALVSPIVAAYAAITILLAVLIDGESLVGVTLAGTILTLLGAGLASADLRALRSSRLLSGGVPWALGAMVLFGVATFVTGHLAQDMGWASATLVSRIGNFTFVMCLVWLMRRQLPSKRRPGDLALAAGVGVADVGGLVAYTLGTQAGNISVVTAASAAFILIPVFGGLVFFHERPAPNQMAGVFTVGLGLVLLGLG